MADVSADFQFQLYLRILEWVTFNEMLKADFRLPDLKWPGSCQKGSATNSEIGRALFWSNKQQKSHVAAQLRGGLGNLVSRTMKKKYVRALRMCKYMPKNQPGSYFTFPWDSPLSLLVL
jgi:hypothetical protein